MMHLLHILVLEVHLLIVHLFSFLLRYPPIKWFLPISKVIFLSLTTSSIEQSPPVHSLSIGHVTSITGTWSHLQSLGVRAVSVLRSSVSIQPSSEAPPRTIQTRDLPGNRFNNSSLFLTLGDAQNLSQQPFSPRDDLSNTGTTLQESAPVIPMVSYLVTSIFLDLSRCCLQCWPSSR
jgi:hypothetical protein